MKERESGADIIRCLAFAFVVIFHSFLYNGYYYAPQQGLAMVVWGGLRWLSVSCIGLFAMLSGYLKAEQSPKGCLHSLWGVVMGYALAAAVSIPARHFVLGDTQSLWEWVQRFLSFRGVSYGWYAEMYVGLVLLMPLLNLGLSQLNNRQMLWATGGLLVMTALPGTTRWDLTPDYWRSFYPATYYAMGACVRRFRPEPRPEAALATGLGLALLLGAATTGSTQGNLHSAYTQEFADLWICAIAACLFIGLYRVRPPKKLARGLAWCAGGCYGGYLLSPLAESWIYKCYPQWRAPEHWGKLLVCGTLPVFFISLLSGKLLSWLTKRNG